MTYCIFAWVVVFILSCATISRFPKHYWDVGRHDVLPFGVLMCGLLLMATLAAPLTLVLTVFVGIAFLLVKLFKRVWK
jgi:hypothetical protein